MNAVSTTCNHRNTKETTPVKITLDPRIGGIIDDCIGNQTPKNLDKLKKISLLGEDKYGRSAITLAALRGMQSMIEFLIETGAPIEQAPPIKDFPLLAAVRMKRDHLIPYLIAIGCDVNQKTKDNMTPLLQSINNNDFVSFSLLLDSGADPFAETCTGKTPLKEAVLEKSMPMISALVAKGAHPSTKDATLQENAFMVAAKTGFIEGLEYFIHLGGVSINEEDNYGCTALSHAIAKKNKPLVKWLIEHGADRNHVNARQETPLTLACRMLYLNMAKTLVKLDVDLSNIDDVIDKTKVSEEQRAKKNHRSISQGAKNVIRYLSTIAQAVDFFFPFRDDSSITFSNLRAEFQDYIHSSHVSVKKNNILGDPLLIWAVKLGLLEETEELLKQRIDIEQKDSKNRSALLYAIAEENLPMVQLLLNYNARVSEDTITFAKHKCLSLEIIELLSARVGPPP